MTGICGLISRSNNAANLESVRLPCSPVGWHGVGQHHRIDRKGLVRIDASESDSVTFTDGAAHMSLICSANMLSESEIQVLFRDLGNASTTALNGLPSEFAICHVDAKRNRLLLATDAFGTIPLFYCENEDSVIFSSDLPSVRSHPQVGKKINKQAIFDFLYFTTVPAPLTISESVRRIPPGHAVVVDESGVRVINWYQPISVRQLGKTTFEKELVDGLETAVSDYWQDDNTACFLSGGLDSSSVCAMASRVSDAPVPAFSIGFNESEYDEIPYARIAADRYGLKHEVHYVSSTEIVSHIDSVASAFGEPFANASTITAMICAEQARNHGFNNLLAGDGGDELFAGNERYSKQMLLHKFDYLPKALRDTLTSIADKKYKGGTSILSKALSYVNQASSPFAKRLQHYNFIEQYGPENIFDRQFLKDVDVTKPTQHIQELFDSSPFDDFLKKMLYVDWKITLADNDLRKVRTACDLAQTSVHFPLLGLDVRHVAESIPSRFLMPRGNLRGFYKSAFGEILPRRIIDKEKHGFGVPVGKWMRSSDEFLATVNSRLASVVDRGIVNPQFVESVRKSHGSGDAVHFGVILWTLFMLETWFVTDHC